MLGGVSTSVGSYASCIGIASCIIVDTSTPSPQNSGATPILTNYSLSRDASGKRRGTTYQLNGTKSSLQPTWITGERYWRHIQTTYLPRGFARALNAAFGSVSRKMPQSCVQLVSTCCRPQNTLKSSQSI